MVFYFACKPFMVKTIYSMKCAIFICVSYWCWANSECEFLLVYTYRHLVWCILSVWIIVSTYPLICMNFTSTFVATKEEWEETSSALHCQLYFKEYVYTFVSLSACMCVFKFVNDFMSVDWLQAEAVASIWHFLLCFAILSVFLCLAISTCNTWSPEQ